MTRVWLFLPRTPPSLKKVQNPQAKSSGVSPPAPFLVPQRCPFPWDGTTAPSAVVGARALDNIISPRNNIGNFLSPTNIATPPPHQTLGIPSQHPRISGGAIVMTSVAAGIGGGGAWAFDNIISPRNNIGNSSSMTNIAAPPPNQAFGIPSQHPHISGGKIAMTLVVAGGSHSDATMDPPSFRNVPSSSFGTTTLLPSDWRSLSLPASSS